MDRPPHWLKAGLSHWRRLHSLLLYSQPIKSFTNSTTNDDYVLVENAMSIFEKTSGYSG